MLTVPSLDAQALAVLAGLLGESAAASATAAALEQLRRAGCVIDMLPQQGPRLRSTGLGCWADYIESRHRDGSGRIGRRLLVYAHTASTQDVARRLVIDGHSARRHDGYVIVADHQTAGRGRLGRAWIDQPGSQLLMTAIVAGEPKTTDRLMLAACHAVAQTVEQAARLPVRVRWPNDLMLGGRKLAGILVETINNSALIGIGLNVSVDPALLPSPLDQLATSLAHHGRDIDRLPLLDMLLNELHQAVHHLTDAQLHDAWRARADMLQQRITVRQGDRTLTGRVLDIDPRCGLLMQVEHGPVVTLAAATTRLALDEAL